MISKPLIQSMYLTGKIEHYLENPQKGLNRNPVLPSPCSFEHVSHIIQILNVSWLYG